MTGISKLVHMAPALPMGGALRRAYQARRGVERGAADTTSPAATVLPSPYERVPECDCR